MPTQFTQLVAFFSVFTISLVTHWYVFARFRRVLWRDDATHAGWIVPIVVIVFIIGDLPFAYLFFARYLALGHDTLTRWVLYPFTVWQALMFCWSVVLIGEAVIRRIFFRRRVAGVRGTGESQ